jgi:hypothetical protein
MLIGILTKIAGPKVLLGLIIAAALAVGSLSYLLLQATEAAGTAQAQNKQYVATLVETEKTNMKLEARMLLRENAVAVALGERDQVINQTHTLQSALTEALDDDECANTAHPSAVTDSLRSVTDRPNKD